MPQRPHPRYRFLDFVLDCASRRLLRGNEAIPLTPKEFQTLVELVTSGGKAIEREALMRAIWPDTVVGDTSLGRNISVLRRHLDAAAIESVPRFGYRFVPQVTIEEDEAPAIVQPSLPAESPPPELRETPPATPVRGERGVPRWGWLLAAVLAVAAVGLAGVLRLRGHRQQLNVPPAEPVVLAVLPFRNLSSDARGSDYLRDGVVDDLINGLGGLDYGQLRVLAGSTTRQYVDSAKTPATIGQETGASLLLEGSVDFRDQAVRLMANLVDARKQTVLWSESFNGPRDELEAEERMLIDRVAVYQSLAARRSVPATAAGKRSAAAEARDEYLRGRSVLALANREAFAQAIMHFERAVAIDPNYARAYAGLAEAYIYRTDTLPMTFCYQRARAAVTTALRLDPGLAEAHRDLGYLNWSEKNDVRTGEQEFKRALELAPADARTHRWYSLLLMAERRTQESLVQARAGLELDPAPVGSIANYGFLLVQGGQVEEGMARLKVALERDPKSEVSWGYTGIGYLCQHRYLEAAAAFDHAAMFEPRSGYRALAAYARGKAGDLNEPRRMQAMLDERIHHNEWVPAQAMVVTALALGHKSEAAKWLRKGVEDHTVTLFELNNEPLYSEIRDLPEFAGLVRMAGVS